MFEIFFVFMFNFILKNYSPTWWIRSKACSLAYCTLYVHIVYCASIYCRIAAFGEQKFLHSLSCRIIVYRMNKIHFFTLIKHFSWMFSSACWIWKSCMYLRIWSWSEVWARAFPPSFSALWLLSLLKKVCCAIMLGFFRDTQELRVEKADCLRLFVTLSGLNWCLKKTGQVM